MRPATAPRLARLTPILLASAFLLGACVTTAAPAWTFEPPPPSASPTAASSASAGPSTAPSTAPSASGAASASAPAPSSGSAAPSGGAGATIKIAATNSTYDTTTLEAPAGAAFHIEFTNNDTGVPHNVQIKAADGSEPFKGSLLTGAASVTYDVPALAAGSYTFSCVVHPSMTGTLTVK
jgi:plastocyanin